MVNLATERFGENMNPAFVTQLDERGKTVLYDGRSGEQIFATPKDWECSCGK